MARSPGPKGKRGLSRRDLLHGASAGLAASLVTPPLSAWSQAGPANRNSTPARPGAAITPDSLPKAWSREEIQRRWQAVRQQMKEANLDCLLVCQHHPGEMIVERQDGDADIEYLTGINLPFKWVVFPLEGKVTAVSTNQIKGAREEKLSQERGIDVRVIDVWSEGIIDAMK